MDNYIYNFGKKVIAGGIIFMSIFCLLVWWKFSYIYALIGFITGCILFSFFWFFLKYIHTKETISPTPDIDQEALKRISTEITNSILVCNPFDDETFNRVINDLKTIIDNNLFIRSHENSSDDDKEKANNKLNDVYAYLCYLRALYVKKPFELNQINILIDKFIWKNN